MTNSRVHVQLKGTNKKANLDGSISISVPRTNLNYLLNQPHSIYVCYHAPTGRLLARTTMDVFREAEHAGVEWRTQDSLTVRFYAPFDADFQSSLHAQTLAGVSANRDERLAWAATPSERFPEAVVIGVMPISVPESRKEAFAVLKGLYDKGQDAVISKSFEQLRACLGPDEPGLVFAYLAEINLGMRGSHFNRDRVLAGIQFIRASGSDDCCDVLYCLANAHSALGETEVAKKLYTDAIRKGGEEDSELLAQCWKNYGTALEKQGDLAEAKRCYENAIELTPDLLEARMALAYSERTSGNLEKALGHYDQVIWAVDDIDSIIATRGHRIEIYFKLGMMDKAYDDIAFILPHSERHPWILERCALQVYNYARTDDSSVPRAITFWQAYLKKRPTDRRAQKERLLCLAHSKMHGQPVSIDYDRFLKEVMEYLEPNDANAAHLWDRVGHWAQTDGDWQRAEEHYRKAYNLEPNRYGYCLGAALNHLDRFDEALPILQEQATKHQPEATSWFQVAVAQEGVGDTDGCIASYQKATELDPDYELAMFNLGGVCWNYGSRKKAIQLWTEAIEKWPSHPLSEKVRRMLSSAANGTL
ncbi:TPR repeat-containing protein YrrB [Botrimarina mediterranea]|uniref:TPR repeat-containing protein YrrB n=3 Tax=Botrimarina mediterranea TaxID=2528022 RepID=A0A518K7T4_9BACT|nr:TPR repeat-containing protein YrrB [Botrimarina mediterranea]